MKKICPMYYKDFRCIGGACTDTCCAGWEIDIDDVTYEKYQKLPEELKQHICGQIGTEGEEHFFLLKDGHRCSFLNEEGLCDIFIRAGENYLCDICREHPRFYNWVGSYTEAGLGLCCEEAERLILGSQSPVQFEEYGEDIGESEDILLLPLLEAREALFVILQDRSQSVFYRMNQVCDFAADLQEVLDFTVEEEIGEQVHRLSQMYKDLDRPVIKEAEKTCEFECQRTDKIEKEQMPYNQAVVEKSSKKECVRTLEQLFSVYAGLEALDSSWTVYMKELEGKTGELLDSLEVFLQAYEDRMYEYEQLMVYFVYRYFLEAVFTLDVQKPVRFAICSTWMILLCDIDCWKSQGSLTFEKQCEIVRRYSKEIEYCTENIEAICKACDAFDFHGIGNFRSLKE